MSFTPKLTDLSDLDGLRRELKGLDPEARLAPSACCAW